MRGNEARAAELETEAKTTSDAADIAQRCAHISFCLCAVAVQYMSLPAWSICHFLHGC